MGTWDYLTPEDFLLHLQQAIPGFAAEDAKHQRAMAYMVWHGSTKLRRHAHHEGYYTFTHEELDEWFGRRAFSAVNERLKIFEVTPNWYADRGLTKAYRLTEQAKAARDAYTRKDYRGVTRVFKRDGTFLRTVPPAVASRDMEGMTATAWRRAKVLNKTRVDLDMLERLRARLADIRQDMLADRLPPVLLGKLPTYQEIDYLHEYCSKVVRMAKTDVAGNGYVMQRYAMVSTGRLFAKGINLQSAPREVKQAALHGLWEYDFANCHFDILDQMAARFGYDCAAIRSYIGAKKATRAAIAKKAGITEEQAKECLLMTMYGAKASEYEDGAIVEAVGVEAARRLYRLDEFRAIKEDIQGARRRILEKWPRTANGRLANAMGRAIVHTDSAERRLAHLVQGVEAAALRAALGEYPDEIVLLQHDGFASIAQLDIGRIERAVIDATGYRLRLEEKRIELDLGRVFLGRSECKPCPLEKPNGGGNLEQKRQAPMPVNTAVAPSSSSFPSPA